MILFVGDSFTWGQGLYFEKWKMEGKSLSYIEKYLVQNSYPNEYLSYKDHVYRKEKRFSNLVASHFNKNFEVLNLMNGGSNWDIFIKLEEFLTYNKLIDLLVVQLTDPIRQDNHENVDKFVPYFSKYMNIIKQNYKNLDDTTIADLDRLNSYNSICDLQVEYLTYISRNLSSIGNYGKLLILSWPEDIGKKIKEKLPSSHIPIIFENNIYDGFHKLLIGKGLTIKETVGCNDLHLNSLGNQVLSNSIISKIKSNKNIYDKLQNNSEWIPNQ